MSAPTFYVTTPIYYVNDSPHIGHAYTTVACDALSRFMRLDGIEVKFLTGTDEHGQKVENAAQAAGEAPQDFVDRVSQRFRDLREPLGLTNDDFIRTTEDRHTASVQRLWRELVKHDEIYLGTYAGWYSVRDEAFYAESELVDGMAPTGAPVEWVEEPSYFFRLSAWQDRLLAFYEENPDAVMPASRRNEVISFVKGGLLDLSVSRTSFKWGVPVPDDPDHVMYVWVDALTNYMTAAGYPDTDCDDFKKFWPADLHMVGKDIVRFHAVYWPAFLMAAGLEPPKRVYAHGWWTSEGQKISKSLGNAIEPLGLIGKFGLDPVRYFMLREVPFGNDGDFSQRAMINRINGDLANDFGNLAQRTLSMIAKNCDRQVPTPGDFSDDDKVLLAAAGDLLDIMREHMKVQEFHAALAAQWRVIAEANRYVDAQAPWTLRKTDPARMATVLYVLAEVIRRLAILAQPVTPGAAGHMLDQLAVAEDARGFANLGADNALTSGTPLPKPQGVFPRHVEEAEEGT
ncbi:MAG: methionine--tRNA ligase [Pseudomonadota bacterium]|nr:methionine--tRNA ligase [Pseudomonadota bacterium]